MKKALIVTVAAMVFFSALAVGGYALTYWQLIPRQTYTAADFNIETVPSGNDADGDGLDDSSDLVQGARAYLQTKPAFHPAFYKGGYPPRGVGMSADVIIEAFDAAGYSLKQLIDEDIARDPSAYPAVNGRPNPDVDFRRTRNLHAFFEQHAQSLTVDSADIEQWQPGDIVVFSGHVALVSDKRNQRGDPYILHLGGQPVTEEDALTRYEIIGHYRWDGSVMDSEGNQSGTI